MSAFCSSAEPRLAELTNALQKMDSTLQSTARHFGENPKTVESHELFSIFDSFFHALEEARSENEKRKLKIKEEEQQIRITRERKERISTASKVNISVAKVVVTFPVHFRSIDPGWALFGLFIRDIKRRVHHKKDKYKQ